jgi:hypothetical protein
MNITTHPVAPEEVMALLDGELSADRAQSVSAHISQCAECQELGTSIRKASAAISKWNVEAAPAGLEARVADAASSNSVLSEKLRSTTPKRVIHWTLRRSVFGLVSTAALALFLIAVSIPTLHRSRQAADFSVEFGRQRQRAQTVAGIDSGPTPSGSPRAAGDYVDATKLYSSSGADKEQMPPPPPALLAGPQGGTGARSLPMIARAVSVSLVVKDFDEARASLDAILARNNGYAAGLNVATPQGAGRALQASLRIPAPRLGAAVSELKALGRVELENQNGEEVTQQHADLVARLKNFRETEQRLQAILLQRTGKIRDVLAVEQEIARVRGEIEQMEAEQQTLEHRVDFATIDLKLAEEYKAQLSSPTPSAATQLRNASVNGFRSAFESLLALVLFLAESGPAILLWLALLFIPVRLLWRRYQRSLAMG